MFFNFLTLYHQHYLKLILEELSESGYFHQLPFAFSDDRLLVWLTIMQSVSLQSIVCVLLVSKLIISGAYFPANSDNSTAHWMTSYIQTGSLPQVLLLFSRVTKNNHWSSSTSSNNIESDYNQSEAIYIIQDTEPG